MEIAIIPKWLIKYFSSDIQTQYNINILISNLLVIIGFLVLKNILIDVANAIPHFCLFDKITGIQCPACGITRAFCELSKGNITQVYQFNLTSIFVMSFFICQIPLRIYALYKPQKQRNINKISKIFSYLVVIVIVANWVVNLIPFSFHFQKLFINFTQS